jgi:hypothetical protein
MPSALGAFDTTAGGGVDVVSAAICRLADGRVTATTADLETSLPTPARAVTEAVAIRGKAGARAGNRGAAPPTAHAITKGAMAATLNAGL